MTMRRWVTTTLVMALVGAGLLALAPDSASVRAALDDPQALVDARGPDVLLVLVAWGLAASCWAWGALGLVVTGLATVPGSVGRVAAGVLVVLLPAGARRAAALAIGVSLVAVPVGSAAATPVGPTGAVAAVDMETPGDWPLGSPSGSVSRPGDPSSSQHVAPTPVPDWPDSPPAGAHVVVRGDCLWDLAERWLTTQRLGATPTPAEVVAAVHTWWQANSDVIGADPDLLFPGQVLVPPPP